MISISAPGTNLQLARWWKKARHLDNRTMSPSKLGAERKSLALCALRHRKYRTGIIVTPLAWGGAFATPSDHAQALASAHHLSPTKANSNDYCYG